MKYLSGHLWYACKSNKVLILLMVGGMVNCLFYDLWSTYFILYIDSFVPDKLSEDEAKSLFSRIMLVSMICGILFVPVVGLAVDRVNPKLLLPLPSIFRGSALLMFHFNTTPDDWFAYVSTSLIVMGHAAELVVLGSMILRNAPK